MSLRLDQLKPYKSFILAEVQEKEKSDKKTAAQIIADLESVIIDSGEALDAKTTLKQRLTPITHAGLTIAGFYYEEHCRPSWTTNEAIVDTLNHLVLVGVRDHHVAICLTDSARRNSVLATFGDKGYAGLAPLRRVSPTRLNAAFVLGHTRTLWLSGVHRRTSLKADAKILSGIDLRDAIDPLADQSYFFSAARSDLRNPTLNTPVGVTPRGSRIWLGATAKWDEFLTTTCAALKYLASVKSATRNPLPVLAVEASDPKAIGDPYDAVLVPPELVADDPSIDPQALMECERWARVIFKVGKAKGANFEAEAFLDGASLGTISLAFDASRLPDITWTADGKPAAHHAEDHKALLQHCRSKDWLKVWFESGHALAEGSIYEMQLRDLPFRQYEWHAFGNIDVTREKPDPLDQIGKQDSLFCWVKRSSPFGKTGWLACDDGAGEKADFIHIDERTASRALTLIHVKGAHSDSSTRKISASAYEVVVSQALKNLRHLDRIFLAEGLKAGLHHRISRLVWHNGKVSSRDRMLNAMSTLGTNIARHVVILQPHLTKQAVDDARGNAKSAAAARLRQLDALLHSAVASCQSVGASFRVIAETRP